MKIVDKQKKSSSPFVGQKIRGARKSAGLTLDDVGQQIGVSVQALSAIERSKANPSRQTLISLARVLENDFGEAWLKRYATGPRKLTHAQIISKALESRDRLVDSSSLPAHVNYLLEWSLEVQDAANLPSPVHIFNLKSALMHIHYNIANGTTIATNEDNYKIVVPYSLIPSVERARCVRLQESPIRDAFLGPGDVLVLYECSAPAESKIVLALVENKVVVRRWELKGRKVIFTALDTDYEPIIAPRKNVEFIGEVLGILRFISTVPLPLSFT